ncbi:MAG: hypothetical protein L0215_21045 [Gemmataceae bacterium]|nr:hypothetical protein [Gemmataceae bacterium]
MPYAEPIAIVPAIYFFSIDGARNADEAISRPGAAAAVFDLLRNAMREGCSVAWASDVEQVFNLFCLMLFLEIATIRTG